MRKRRTPDAATKDNAINWFGAVGSQRVGVIFDPEHRVGNRYVEGKTIGDFVVESNSGLAVALNNVSEVCALLEVLEVPSDADLKAACMIIADMTGLDSAVNENHVYVYPGDAAPSLQCRYGMQFACDLPRFDADERRITFFAVESMYTGEFDARLYRVEIDLKQWLVQVSMTACTFQWPSPVQFDGQWVPVSELDSLWIPDMRTGPPFNGTCDSKRSTPEKFTS